MTVHMELLSDVLADRVQRRPLPISPQPIVITEIDDAIPDDAITLDVADGQSFIIEYVDAKADFSRRRITVWEILEADGGVPWLYARCHERKAMRAFRLDRIRCCIDHSGKAYDNVALFLSELFGTPISPAGDPGGVKEAQSSAWQKVLRAVHHEAVILSALARVDHVLDRRELQAAADYLALEAEDRDAPVSDRELIRLIDHVSGLRPNRQAIDRALDAISRLDLKAVQRLLSAAITVMDADGQRHALEVELINRVAVELIGVAVIGQ